MGLHTAEEVADTVEGEVLNAAAPRRVGGLVKNPAPLQPAPVSLEEAVEV